MSPRRVYLPFSSFTSDRAVLTKEARHHLVNVLRLKPGERVEVFDGRGGAFSGTLLPGLLEVELGPRREQPLTGLPIHLVVALAKGEKMDFIVQKATELGATAISPFEAERSVVRLDEERGLERANRWRRIAKEAARQCGRADVPDVLDPEPLDQALEAVPAGFAIHVFHLSRSPREAARDDETREGGLGHALVVGPEGGLTEAEHALCLRAGARTASLGPRILRAETAAIVAVALVQVLRGDMAVGFLDPVPARS